MSDATPVQTNETASAVVEKTPPVMDNKPTKAEPPARKRKYEETVAQVQANPFEQWLEEHLPKEPISSAQTMGRTTAPLFPMMDGLMEIINEATERIDGQLGFQRTPNNQYGQPEEQGWLRPLKWACLRELALFVEYHYDLLRRPRPVNPHNRLLIPMDVAAAISWLRPYKDTGTPTLYLDVDWVRQAILNEWPGFDPEDANMLRRYNNLLPFFTKNRLKTLSTVELDLEVSLLAVGCLKDGKRRAIVSEKPISTFQMLTALKLDLTRCEEVDGIYLPRLQQGNRHLSPLLSSYRSGEYIDVDFVWAERIHHAMSLA